MSLCYDFEKWTMITLASVAISLTVGLVILVGEAYGQNQIMIANATANATADVMKKAEDVLNLTESATPNAKELEKLAIETREANANATATGQEKNAQQLLAEQQQQLTTYAINNCIKSKDTNFAIVSIDCHAFNLAVNKLIIEGFDIKSSNNFVIFLSR